MAEGMEETLRRRACLEDGHLQQALEHLVAVRDPGIMVEAGPVLGEFVSGPVGREPNQGSTAGLFRGGFPKRHHRGSAFAFVPG